MTKSTPMTLRGQFVTCRTSANTLKSHGPWIQTETQAASDDIAVRAHCDVLHRRMQVAYGAFQTAVFEDGACARFRRQHLHDARGALRGVRAGDPQACTGSHQAVAVVVQSGQKLCDGLCEECPRSTETGF